MRAIVLSLLLLATLPAAGQRAAEMMRLDIVVTDSSGKPVTDLTKDSFLVLEDGQSREIKGFEPVDTPWNLVLLLDDGLSWTGPGAVTRGSPGEIWRKTGERLNPFLARLNPQDKVAIALFENKVELLMDFRSARSGRGQNVTIPRSVQGFAGAKDLHGAIVWALEKLRGAPGRKAVILLTDGRDGRLEPQWVGNDRRQEVFDPLFGLPDNAEAAEFTDTLDRIRQSGVRLFFVAVNTRQSPEFRGRPISGLYPGSREAVEDYLARVRVRMEKMAEVSGGSMLYGDTPDDALTHYDRLYERLMIGIRYTLEYEPLETDDELLPRTEIRLRDAGLAAAFQRSGKVRR